MAAGKLDPSKVNEKTFAEVHLLPGHAGRGPVPAPERRAAHLQLPDLAEAYAEMVFQDVLWPDFDRRDLCARCLEYAQRDRRFARRGPQPAGAEHPGLTRRPRP
ncbi:undecaprenyl diphosphate synthase family protein [Streptomyces cirratus]